MLFALAAYTAVVTAAALPENERRQFSPVVELDTATVTGSSLLGIDSFNGIPFAQPPVGNLRLRPPQPITANLGKINAVGMPKSCPQSIQSSDLQKLPPGVVQTLLNTPLFTAVSGASEDCLTLNVQRPSGIAADAKLPVFVWIYGGGFTAGSAGMYDGSGLIRASQASSSIVYVALQYRLGGFGFLPGKEVQDSGNGNLGLLDQRLALQWVADNIAKFGGDPDRVTIGGESAGAISVFDQLALYDGDNTYKGKPLFRGAIMNSGSVVPADPVSCPKGQVIYNQVVREAGCAAAADTLQCLREVDFDTFSRAATSPPGIFDYSSVALSYLPRPDGKSLTDSPTTLVQQGKFAKVPFIVGDQEDEGTLFSLVQANLTTTADVVDYLGTYFFNNAPRAQIQSLVDSYPNNPIAGSPFRTGLLNILYPQYKRLAALLGDATFTLTRRIFLELAAPQVPKAFSYLGSYNYGTPILGSFHASDILALFFVPGYPQATIQRYYINFINNLDPNVGVEPTVAWPQWTAAKQLLNIEALSSKLIPDNFRESSAAVLRSGVSGAFNI
ncbi:lipase [Protomyces lactucae-debilis]|uniref:Carboxylic ester hydrolase n=1 Tax=Protomyces lactucae-debilis TaxID=2754530 RepID=A0A1Y2EW11_PROLT|nr:lipase [Protomyces lactucae-debilis]ORY75783.1 lipase [Protomyces lactucae-debilis]